MNPYRTSMKSMFCITSSLLACHKNITALIATCRYCLEGCCRYICLMNEYITHLHSFKKRNTCFTFCTSVFCTGHKLTPSDWNMVLFICLTSKNTFKHTLDPTNVFSQNGFTLNDFLTENLKKANKNIWYRSLMKLLQNSARKLDFCHHHWHPKLLTIKVGMNMNNL